MVFDVIVLCGRHGILYEISLNIKVLFCGRGYCELVRIHELPEI